jgi:hypothetical protein
LTIKAPADDSSAASTMDSTKALPAPAPLMTNWQQVLHSSVSGAAVYGTLQSAALAEAMLHEHNHIAQQSSCLDHAHCCWLCWHGMRWHSC